MRNRLGGEHHCICAATLRCVACRRSWTSAWVRYNPITKEIVPQLCARCREEASASELVPRIFENGGGKTRTGEPHRADLCLVCKRYPGQCGSYRSDSR
jgi:hypothetical protein